MNSELLEIFKQQKGYLQSKQLTNRAMQYQLKAMVENGEVQMLKRGLYKHNILSSSNGWVEASLIVPKGVLCLFSVWQYYELVIKIYNSAKW